MTEPSQLVDIAGIDKDVLLQGLVNGATVLGMGFLQDIGRGITVEEARDIIENGGDHERSFPLAKKTYDNNRANGRLYFDYVLGKPIKSNIAGDDFDPDGYDRNNGRGAASRVIAEIRASS